MLTQTALAVLLLASTAPGWELADYRTEDEGKAAWLGVYLGGADRPGVQIIDLVGDDSPAAVAGLQKHDIIIRFDGDEVTDVEGLVNQVREASPDQRVYIDVDRDGQELTFAVVLGTRPKDLKLDMPKMKILRRGGAGMHEELQDILKDLDVGIGQIKVQVECEEGKGTVTIEKDGIVETREIDCPPDDQALHGFHFDWHGDDLDLKIPKMLELHMPHLEKLEEHIVESAPGLEGRVRALVLGGEPRTNFHVDPDGRIHISVRKGDSELTMEFADVDDLRARRPALYEKYEDLISELE